MQDGSAPAGMRAIAQTADGFLWLASLIEQQVEEVVMESTAQYWKPVRGALEEYWKPTGQKRGGTGPMSGTLHPAQAQSNRLSGATWTVKTKASLAIPS